MKVKFTIPGEPTGKGRPRFSRQGQFVRTYTPAKTENYEALVRLAYQQQCRGVRFDDDAMIDARIMCYFAVPKSASKKKTTAMLAGKIRPTKKPDADNIVKIILDSCNQVAYRDDTQVVDCQVRKFYSIEPKVVVTFRDAWRQQDEGA